MTLRHLRIFLSVCECESLTMAAKRLYIAQPSVSLAIAELEKYYKVKLFDRLSRRLYITEEGKRFYEYASQIISLYDRMEESIRDSGNGGVLRVGSSITIGNFLMPGLAKSFSEICPSVEMQVMIDNSEAIEDKILSAEIDLGLIEGVTHHTQLKSEVFMDDELVLLCGRGHPLYGRDSVSVKELAGHRFILREKGSGTRELFDSSLLVHDMVIRPVWESTSTHAILHAVGAGLGLSVLPFRLAERNLAEGSLHRIAVREISFGRKFYLIHHINKYLTGYAKQFIDLVKHLESAPAVRDTDKTENPEIS